MGTLNRNTRLTLAASIVAVMGKMFGKTPKHLKPRHEGPAKRFRYTRPTQNPAGSKIRRAIARGNFGLVNKHGMIGRAVAEQKRENWLLDHGKPVIRLSTSV